MKTTRITLPKVYVIGKECCAKDNKNFVNDLWQDVYKHFEEISHLITWNEDGTIKGMWGVMRTDDKSFEPKSVENGYFLAGLECNENTIVPAGWEKVEIPSYEYIKAEIESAESFKEVIGYLIANKIEIVGTVQNYTDTKNQQNYIMLPIRKI